MSGSLKLFVPSLGRLKGPWNLNNSSFQQLLHGIQFNRTSLRFSAVQYSTFAGGTTWSGMLDVT